MLEIDISYSPATLLMDMYPKDPISYYKDIYSTISIIALFTMRQYNHLNVYQLINR